MVLYELFLTIKNTSSFAACSSLLAKISLEVVKDGGVVRSVMNHGIRDVPHRVKARRPDIFGNRWFDKARHVSVYYDGNPTTMKHIENVLVFNDDVLRRFTLKARNPMWFVNIAREDRNPYIKQVRKMEMEEERQQAKMMTTTSAQEEEKDSSVDTVMMETEEQIMVSAKEEDEQHPGEAEQGSLLEKDAILNTASVFTEPQQQQQQQEQPNDDIAMTTARADDTDDVVMQDAASSSSSTASSETTTNDSNNTPTTP